MIDLATGDIVLDGGSPNATTIGASLSRSAFLASALVQGAQSSGVASEWPLYYVGQHRVFGDPCGVTLAFHGEALEHVALMPQVDSYDFDDALKAKLDAWLAAKLGPLPSYPNAPLGHPVGYAYPWGSIGSYYQPQDMTCLINVSYKR